MKIFSLLALIKKEFLALLKDKRSRLTIIVPPLMQLMVFGYAATYDLEHVPVAIYNEDRGQLSRDLAARFSGSRHFKKISIPGTPETVKAGIDDRDILMVVHIRSDFTRQLLSGNTAEVQVLLDGRNSNTAYTALSYARNIINTFNRKIVAKNAASAGFGKMQVRVWYNPNLESRWFIVPGIMGVLTLLVTLLVTALSVAREREQGTFDQLLVTPFSPVEILAGKSIPGLIIGLGEGTVCLLIILLWFRVPFQGGLLMLYGGLFVFLISAVGVGLMISSLAVTQQQGLLGAFLFMVPAVILSGFTTPIENMPAVLQKLTLVNPLRYFMVVVRGVFLENTPAGTLCGQIWPMAVIGCITLTFAAWLFRRRVN